MTEKVSPCKPKTIDEVTKNISATADIFKEVAADIICNAFHREAEGFVAEFLTVYELVLNADDEAALTEHVCGFFANFGGNGSAHDVLWRYLCRRIDERFPLKGFVNV
jgi:hypothetical protein